MGSKLRNRWHSVIGSACVAAIPLLILFLYACVRKSKGHIAAIAGLAGALIVAVTVWGMPIKLAISSTLMGAAFGLFPIVWIVVTAVWGLQHDRGIGRIWK